jgi:hypothetical protein
VVYNLATGMDGMGYRARPISGSSEMVTINQRVDIAEEIAGIELERHYKFGAPKGVSLCLCLSLLCAINSG